LAPSTTKGGDRFWSSAVAPLLFCWSPTQPKPSNARALTSGSKRAETQEHLSTISSVEGG